MAVSAAFAAQAYAAPGQLWLLYALAMVQAVLQAISAPARRTGNFQIRSQSFRPFLHCCQAPVSRL